MLIFTYKKFYKLSLSLQYALIVPNHAGDLTNTDNGKFTVSHDYHYNFPKLDYYI